MGKEGGIILEEGADAAGQTEKWKRIAWFVDRRAKAKLTLLSIALVTAAFYLVIFLGIEFDCWVKYAAVIVLLSGGYSAADVMNTLSYNKSKGNSNGPGK